MSHTKDGLTVEQAKDGLHKAALEGGIDLPKPEHTPTPIDQPARTPTPWHWIMGKRWARLAVGPTKALPHLVDATIGEGLTEQDAAFIVEACNAHVSLEAQRDVLLSDLGYAVRSLEALEKSANAPIVQHIIGPLRRTIEWCEAAIALCEKGE